MKETTGNLITLGLAGDFDVLIHGCNCFNTMGSGIAAQIKRVSPEAYAADQRTTRGDKSKLGTYSFAEFDVNGRTLVIVNAYTQYSFGLDKRHTNYDALRSVFKLVAKDFAGQRIGYPRIGAFRGGEDWEIISQIIDCELAGQNHTLVRFENV